MVKDFGMSSVNPFGRAKREGPVSLSQAVEIQEMKDADEPKVDAVEPVVEREEPVEVIEETEEVRPRYVPAERPAPVWREQPKRVISGEEQERRAKAHRKKEGQYTDATTIRLSPEVYKALKYASFDMGVPMWAIVNEALHCVLVEPGEFDWERARYVAKHF